MSCRLRSYDVSPPGGYLYVQTQGIRRSFSSVPIIEGLAKEVSAFRQGNKLPRANLQQCIEDVDHYNAARIGCHKAWTVPINSPAEAKMTAMPRTSPFVAKPCKGCGAQIFSLPNP